jgi:hypothetical protein
MGNIERAIDGLRILWTDRGGVTHRCERAELFPGVKIAWTDCGIDLPEDDAAYLPGDGDEVTCPKCLADALG